MPARVDSLHYALWDNIGAIAVDEWDRLASGNLYQSHGWLTFLERGRPPGSQRYMTVRDDGLAAGVPVFAWSGSQPERMLGYDLRHLIGPGDWFPTLVVGARSGRYNVPLIANQDTRVGRCVMGQLGDLADAVDARSISVLYVPAPVAHWVAGSLDDTWRALLCGATAVLDIEWSSFDGYLHALGKKRRQSARRELLVSGDRQVRFLASCARRVAPLVAGIHRRHGEQITDAEIGDRLHGQADHLGDSALVFALEEGDRVTAAAVAFRCGAELYVRALGLADGAPAGAYFVAGYYEPIRYAIEEGVHRVHFGINAYRPKLLRGARLAPLWSFVWSRDALPTQPDIAKRNASQAARWTDAYRPLSGERWCDVDWRMKL